MGIISSLGGMNPYKSLYHSPKPRSDVYCFKLNFNISKLGYSGMRGPFRAIPIAQLPKNVSGGRQTNVTN